MTELEKMQRAKMYIDKLANGINPLTDTEMPENETLNQVRISRCLFYVSEVLGRVIDNGGEVGRKGAVLQLPFSVTDEQLSKAEISEQPVGVAIIAKRIAAVLDENVKSVPATHISNWLVQNGYLTECIRMNKREKISTQKGEAFGFVLHIYFILNRFCNMQSGIFANKSSSSCQTHKFSCLNSATVVIMR